MYFWPVKGEPVVDPRSPYTTSQILSFYMEILSFFFLSLHFKHWQFWSLAGKGSGGQAEEKNTDK
jgi:hypothetical protein